MVEKVNNFDKKQDILSKFSFPKKNVYFKDNLGHKSAIGNWKDFRVYQQPIKKLITQK